MKKPLNHKLYPLLIWLSPVFLGIIILILYKLNIFIPTKMLPKCFVKSVTGYDCFGCGCTRAVQSLLNFDISSSISFNPVIFQAVIIYIIISLTHIVSWFMNLYVSFKAYKKRSALNKTERFQFLNKFHGLKPTEFYLYLLLGSTIIFGSIRFILEITGSLTR